MSVYDDDIQTAIELIDEFGQQCYWQKPAPTVAAEPGYPAAGAVPQPVPVKIAFFSERDLNRGVFEALGMMPESEVPENAQIGLMAGGLSFTPENTDSIRRGAANANPIAIVKMDILAPDGTPILYFITVTA